MERVNIIIKNIPNKSILKMIMKDLEYSKKDIEHSECLDIKQFPVFLNTSFKNINNGIYYSFLESYMPTTKAEEIEWYFYLNTFPTNSIINLLKESTKINLEIRKKFKKLLNDI